jgi:hypothetical protein
VAAPSGTGRTIASAGRGITAMARITRSGITAMACITRSGIIGMARTTPSGITAMARTTPSGITAIIGATTSRATIHRPRPQRRPPSRAPGRRRILLW